MLTCPACGSQRSSRNDVLQCIVVNHDAEMRHWRAFRHMHESTDG